MVRIDRGMSEAQRAAIEEAEATTARNYAPLPIVIESGDGAWVTDVDGRRYLDCLAAYSAVNFGHGHPELVRVAHEQLDRLTLTSRAFHSAPLGPFTAALGRLVGTELVLPMNSGAEAVESAVKVARKWAYRVKGVPDGRARIIAMAGNFHGRTTTIISFSDDPVAHDDYGPYTPGFDLVPFGDLEALRAAIDDDTAAVLLEPIQGEAGVIVPPDGYLEGVRELTRERNVLLVCDEIQSGLGRTGDTFRFQAAGITPDLVTVGKALGGGIVPVSAVAGDRDVLGVLEPGTHGSTFGGNPLAAAVGRAVCGLLETGEYQERARTLGARLFEGLHALEGHGVTAVRGAGLWAGVDLDPAVGTGRDLCLALLDRGVLAKDTHGRTVRFAPPLVVTADEIDLLLDALGDALRGL